MKTLVHLSDLHFGKTESQLVEAIAAEVRAVDFDLLVVSGDLTQRARKDEFLQARACLDSLPGPRIVVPGNHDVPLWNVFARAVTPLARYRRYIEADTDPFYADSEVAVVGINTARSLTIKDGRINVRQLEAARDKFANMSNNVTRIVVTHHPFEGLDLENDDGIVGRADLAMDAFSRSGVDVILSGHQHLHRAGSSARRYLIDGYAALLIQAGTAVSSRVRHAANSFNIIRVEHPRISVECRAWQSSRSGFETSASYSFRQGPGGWEPA
ncbi:metallophosphatase [Mesorhizobium sp. WSM4312]|uniref:metallophosphoesterase family protein n=1 Tax=unclassified Mesorhizobium TaxID=325217 RepID=UPI000BAFFE5D|nr:MULTISPECIES: metallophosphoesterase [unclassified Mesorhizobium]PBB65279.1 metallophosphatase [Mesorhizobium sp. WSM4312]PBC20164.1 metallophosphatase [Mesorhizobium sp. WSM4311]TRC97304.1 metallophosphoesterase [Mesorhizobium sp. WSM4305]